MQAVCRKRWWNVVPVIALSLVPFRAQAQSCGGAIGATASVPDMAEEGGVGTRVQTLAEQALERIASRDGRRPWPADTMIWVRRVQVIVQMDPAPPDSAAARLRITVVAPD